MSNQPGQKPPSDKDMMAAMGLGEKLQDIEADVAENMSDAQINTFARLNKMLSFREKLFTNHIRMINEGSYIELNKNLVDFCRSSCIEPQADIVSESEKRCLKSCTNKYLQQFQIFDSYQKDLISMYGIDIFLFEEPHKNAMSKLIEMISLNKKY